MHWRALLRACLLQVLIVVTPAAIASQYSPPGLYDVEHLTLDNGMDVIFKQRSGAHTLSVRLWVGVGMQDFECEHQETPHFLEHLLFTGTSRYSEAELEHLVADHGGSWNAYTGNEETVYQMDIYSRYPDLAINTLYEILTDSIISDENVETSRDIIHREVGGKPSKIRQWFRLRGFGVNGTEKAVLKLLPGVDYVCEGLRTADHITRQDIIDTYDRYYVPENMALIVVGDFEREPIMELIKNTFGRIQVTPSPERVLPSPGVAEDYEQETGTLSPLLSNDAVIGVMYAIPGFWSEDIFPLMIIEHYLDFKLGEEIRIKRGLSYSPGVWRETLSKFGLISIYADVNIDDIEETMGVIRSEIKKLVDESMDSELLEKSKMKILLQNVQGYESNSQFADYYASDYVYFKEKGNFQDVEAKIEAVTPEDIARVADKYLSLHKGVVIYETPTLTTTQFYVLMTIIVVILLSLVLYLYLKSRSPTRPRS
ncbi:MAG: insulinase family protein [Thiotrichales bacterium]|nr:MAG: insulinase family protein [Thiotrichales bacterium]